MFQDRPTIQNVKIYDADVCVEQNDKGEFSVVSTKKNIKETTDVKTDYPFEDLSNFHIFHKASHSQELNS